MERAAECIKHEGASGRPCGYADELSAFSGVSGARLQTHWHCLVLKNCVNTEQAVCQEVTEETGAQSERREGKEFESDPKKQKRFLRKMALIDAKTRAALARKQKVIRLEWI